MDFRTLTKAQADAVKGPAPRLGPDGKPFAALEPVELKTGEWVLPDDVIADKAHAQHAASLGTKPQRPVLDVEWKRNPDLAGAP